MILAHSFGQRYDLPIPLALFVAGGGLVVLLSFALVQRRAEKDQTPSYDDVVLSSTTNPFLGWLSLAVTGALVYAGLAGVQEIAENIVPTVFWLLVWIAVPLSCGLVGDWTRPINPFAFLARLTDRSSVRRALLAREVPLRWASGWWPATVVLFLLACGELVFNQTATQPQVIASGFLVYALVNLLTGLLFGAAWVERGEVWYVGVVVIVAAHILAVALAHRHLAARAADEGRVRRSEYPWLVAMVLYTMVSLTLIAQPLVQENGMSAPQVGPTGTTGPAAGAGTQHRSDVTSRIRSTAAAKA